MSNLEFLSFLHGVSAVCGVFGLCILWKLYSRSSGSSTVCAALYYGILSFLVTFLIFENIGVIASYSMGPFPKSSPWDFCFTVGVLLVSVNVAVFMFTLCLSFETWFLICCIPNKKDCPRLCIPLLRPALRALLYITGSLFWTVTIPLGLGFERGYGYSKMAQLCSTTGTGPGPFMHLYIAFTYLLCIAPLIVSIRVLFYIHTLGTLNKNAFKVLFVPMVTAVVNAVFLIGVAIDFFAAVKGSLIFFAIFFSNRKKICPWPCNLSAEKSSSVYTSFASEPEEDSESNEGSFSMTSYTPPSLKV